MTAPADLAGWRKALRQELVAARAALEPAVLSAYRHSIDFHLRRALQGRFVPADGARPVVIAFCWPYKNEYDARHLLAGLRRDMSGLRRDMSGLRRSPAGSPVPPEQGGLLTALPVVVAPKTPLVFRLWHPGVTMAKGPLGIPFPCTTAEVRPDAVLLPVVGFDAAGYRLGYGGGYFDRTLAAQANAAHATTRSQTAAARPLVIGIAYEMLAVPTIFPQPHDQPLDVVVTERGVYERIHGVLQFRGSSLSGYSSPACLAGEIAPGYFGEAPG